jgi:adenosine deaminase
VDLYDAIPKGRAALPYDSLDCFLKIFWVVQELISDGEAWARVAYESVADGAPHGLRYREAFFTPARHLAVGQSSARSCPV